MQICRLEGVSSMNEEPEVLSGTIVWVAPFYNRSRYGLEEGKHFTYTGFDED
jgi:hypothetical protein